MMEKTTLFDKNLPLQSKSKIYGHKDCHGKSVSLAVKDITFQYNILRGTMEIVADMTIPVKYSRKGEKTTRRCQKISSKKMKVLIWVKNDSFLKLSKVLWKIRPD